MNAPLFAELIDDSDRPTPLVRTARLDDVGDLLDALPPDPVFAWIRDGEGLAGWGEFARLELTGPDATERAQAWWRKLLAGWEITDHLGLPGTGPVLFGSVAFDRERATSVFVVPRVVLGKRGSVSWVTSFSGNAPMREPSPVTAPRGVRYSDGGLDPAEWCDAVDTAVRRIRAGELGKVVLARDLTAVAESDIDHRHLLRRLVSAYPSCWTYAVDGLIGATPELLVRRVGNEVSSLVLAGTSWGPDADELLTSAKNREEHEYAVASLAARLGDFCSQLDVPAEPELLRLPNVVHLASAVHGRAAGDDSSLTLAGAVHPTAAVCGTPTDVALRVIRELEGMDRGRYAGPVGWMDSRGDGEWGVALRCAQVSGARLRLYAGCGIVADSDPDTELVESQNKLVVIRDALESDQR